MKNYLIALFLVVTVCLLKAEVPQTISWQGILQDADAKNLSGTYSLTVKLFDLASGGQPIWSETHSNVAIADGLVNLTLGSVTPLSLNFDNPYWLEITVGSGTPLPRIKLTSVPYSLRSKTTDLFNETDPLFSASPSSGISNTNISNWNTAYGWGDHSSEGYLKSFTETDPKWSGTANSSSNIGRTGNVGIGTFAPTAQFHTTGTIRFQGAGTPANGKVLTSDLNGNATWQNPLEGSKWTLSNDHIFNNNIGNVGIGINNPATNLHISANGFFSSLLLTNTNVGETFNDGLLIALQYQEEVQVNRYGIFWMKENIPLFFKAGSSGVFNEQLTLLPNGNIGIGTSTPTALLHTNGIGTGGGNVLFAGLQKNSPGDPPISGEGTRMMWYPDKAAFRAGYVSSNNWDKDSIGTYSVAIGHNSKAKSLGSIAIGSGTIASASNSMALGAFTTASGSHSTAIGYNTTASGNYSIAMGENTIAKSAFETVVGYWNADYTPSNTEQRIATDHLFVVGNGLDENHLSNALTILKNSKVGIGTSAINPEYLLSIGDNGNGLHRPSANTLAFHTSSVERMRLSNTGNLSIGSTSISGNKLWVLSDASGGTNSTCNFENTNSSGLALRATTNSSDGTMLSIQQGEGYSLRCDGYDPGWFVAMIVKGRQVGINTSSPTQNLDVNGNARFRSIGSGTYLGVVNRTSDGTLTTSTSDIRFKDNILTLQNSLDRVKQLRGVSFIWKNNPEYGTRIGFVAQEFEKVVPELAFTNPTDGFMGINYAEMTAVLVEAMKEQQAIIEEQNKRIDDLEKKLELIMQQFSEKNK